MVIRRVYKLKGLDIGTEMYVLLKTTTFNDMSLLKLGLSTALSCTSPLRVILNV